VCGDLRLGSLDIVRSLDSVRSPENVWSQGNADMQDCSGSIEIVKSRQSVESGSLVSLDIVRSPRSSERLDSP